MRSRAIPSRQCVTLPAAAEEELPLRRLVARAIADESARGCLRGYRVHVGSLGDLSQARASEAYSPGYLKTLLDSKIVVTCSPNYHEGDARLGEALASGALVLANNMLDPLPGMIDGTNVITYQTTHHLVKRLRVVLAALNTTSGLNSAQRIAHRGRQVPRTPSEMVDSILETALGPATPPARTRVFVPLSLMGPMKNELTFTLEGIAQSRRAVRTERQEDAEIALIDIHRLRPWARNLTVLCAGYPPSLPVVALDWSDGQGALVPTRSAGSCFSVIFKRSRVIRARTSSITCNASRWECSVDQKTVATWHVYGRGWSFPREIEPLYYPVKFAFLEALRNTSRQQGWDWERPWAERFIDVSVLFDDRMSPIEYGKLRDAAPSAATAGLSRRGPSRGRAYRLTGGAGAWRARGQG